VIQDESRTVARSFGWPEGVQPSASTAPASVDPTSIEPVLADRAAESRPGLAEYYGW